MPRVGLLLVLLVSPAHTAQSRPDLSDAHNWACFYGGNISQAAWGALDAAFVDPDAFHVPSSTGGVESPGPIRLAYVSVGEAEEHRPGWRDISQESYIIEPNPDWPGAHRVDIRSKLWQSYVLDTLVAAALQKGYSGVMLDTLDTAEYFESSAPVRFAGSVRAAADFVHELRARFPGIAIVINNALPLLESVSGAVDGVLVEDIYTSCLPQSQTCTAVERAQTEEKETRLARFREKTGKPVFILVFGRPSERDSRLMRGSVSRARAAGFFPYLVSPELQRLGVVDPFRGK